MDLRHNTNSVGTAFDVVLTDTLPAELENFSIVEVIGTNMVAPAAGITGSTLRWPATGTVDIVNADGINARVSIIIRATIKDSTQPGAVVANRVNATWSTLDGTPPEERISGNGLLDQGGLNDYEVKTQRDFTVANLAAVSKELTATSATHTTGSNVTIGEIVTYRIPVTLGEGTIASLVLTDSVPAGMTYVGGSLVVDDSRLGRHPPHADRLRPRATAQMARTWSSPSARLS